ncbi:MAG TPA: hypothetical protein VFD85_01945 [Gemmatimonadales bacterium]|nr:hypothetical protein [Gemmatimonadales bacterium]HZH39737.1 hypothetical protein [Gemmatimonadales bacterium]
MGIEIPAWAIGVALILFVSAMVKAVGRGGGSREKFSKFRGSEDHERRIADLEDSHRQLAAGSGDTAELERRLAELEERLDFAERMLAKQKDAERLGPPKA